MRRFLVPLAAAFCFTAGGAALAEEKPKSLKDRIVCRTEVATGSRVARKRMCAPQWVWDQIREEHLQSNEHRKVDAEKSRPFKL